MSTTTRRSSIPRRPPTAGGLRPRRFAPGGPRAAGPRRPRLRTTRRPSLRFGLAAVVTLAIGGSAAGPVAAAPPKAPAPPVATPSAADPRSPEAIAAPGVGVGTLRLGMRLPEATAAVGERPTSLSPEDTGNSWRWQWGVIKPGVVWEGSDAPVWERVDLTTSQEIVRGRVASASDRIQKITSFIPGQPFLRADGPRIDQEARPWFAALRRVFRPWRTSETGRYCHVYVGTCYVTGVALIGGVPHRVDLSARFAERHAPRDVQGRAKITTHIESLVLTPGRPCRTVRGCQEPARYRKHPKVDIHGTDAFGRPR